MATVNTSMSGAAGGAANTPLAEYTTLRLGGPAESCAVAEHPDELVAAVREAVGTHDNQAVVIAGDRAVRYEEVLKVLDVLQQNQVKRVGLLARPAS